MTPGLDEFLKRAEAVIHGHPNGSQAPASPVNIGVRQESGLQAGLLNEAPFGEDDFRETSRPVVHVGVDLGTANTVLVVLDRNKQPLAGEYRFAQIVRDGLVVDFHGAIDLLRELKQQVEARLGFELTSAATTHPPGIPAVEVRATRHVVEAAGFECEHVVDEPTAANAVLQIKNGAVVDVGGGTTGVAVIRHGEVIYAADEPTGGTHFSLVIAGACDMSFEQAEEFKRDLRNHDQLFPMVRPVMEKVGTIVARHVASYDVDTLYLVGGTACFTGIDRVIQEVTGIKTLIPTYPLFVTPLGVAMYDT